MEQVTIDVYKFEELGTEAKDKAVSYYRENWMDHNWWDSTYEDFITILNLLGFTPSTTTRHTTKGKSYEEPNIFFSGFWSQGDGASFEGYFTISETLKAVEQLKTHVGEDAVLHGIAESIQVTSQACLEALGAGWPEALGSCVIRITRPGSPRYSHEMTMDVDMEPVFDEIAYQLGDDYDKFDKHAIVNTYGEAMLSHARSLARWLYKALESDYEAQTSEEAIGDSYAANEVRFLEDGSIFSR
ncbi:hypothetical protein [Ferribacterium limneticum]|uniref:hypothetical protein n=1 Tax=Ferribacterium limneticum TaxID=76259 RepID=UPI001CF8A94E|nr:hypothetical protein [Ferribacterium limneticum]UCV26732.1 hypothetical protein KI617_10465 [Ferribacterium limneticum]UCV30649.1 hypothetical protein KI608_10465 [Ferribacterium limneticum]